jgi:hypothetical protein
MTTAPHTVILRSVYIRHCYQCCHLMCSASTRNAVRHALNYHFCAMNIHNTNINGIKGDCMLFLGSMTTYLTAEIYATEKLLISGSSVVLQCLILVMNLP